MQHKPLILALLAGLTLSSAAQAALIDRGGGLIYDDVLNITWQQDANLMASNSFGLTYGQNFGTDIFGNQSIINNNGTATWGGAQAWITAMNNTNYLGYDDWRLPKVLPLNGMSFQYYKEPDYLAGTSDNGYNISAPGTLYEGSTVSELAYMYHNTLDNKGSVTISGVSRPGSVVGLLDDPSNPNDESLFSNLQSHAYWSGTESGTLSEPNTTSHAWIFATSQGSQYNDWKGDSRIYAWAVRDGDVSAVPEPNTLAMLLAGLGLVGVATRRRRG